MAEITTLAYRSAFHGLLEAVESPSASPGVSVRELSRLDLASVFVRKGAGVALKARTRDLYAIDLAEDRPGGRAAGATAFVATGPGAWLAVHEAPGADWAQRLAVDLRGLASVADQSDGYGVLRLSGPRVRELLAKGLFIDLHPGAFPVGAAAGASIAHIGVTVWRREDEVFDLLVFRSYAADLWHWVVESAAEFGLAISSPEEAG